MKKVLFKATNEEFIAKQIEGGYEVYTLAGEKYKKIKDSTFKRYFKVLGDVEKPETKATEEKKQDKAEEKKASKKTEKAEKPEVKTVSAEKRQQIIDKIKKLLTLSGNNPNESEAVQAAMKAQQLMAEYAISEDETLDEIKPEDSIDSIMTEQKHDSSLHSWRKQLAVIIARNFRCKCYMRGQDVVFRGFKADAEIALSVYTYLYTTGDKLGSKSYMEQLKNTGSGKGAYNSFVMGFLKGVDEGLSVQCTALMLIVPQAVEEEFKQFSAKMKTSKTKAAAITDRGLYEKGKTEGKNAVKQRAIEKKGKKEE